MSFTLYLSTAKHPEPCSERGRSSDNRGSKMKTRWCGNTSARGITLGKSTRMQRQPREAFLSYHWCLSPPAILCLWLVFKVQYMELYCPLCKFPFTKCFVHYLPIFIFPWTCQITSFADIYIPGGESSIKFCIFFLISLCLVVSANLFSFC